MTRIYQTNFPLTENPISEGGRWLSGRSHGLDWADVITTPGLARGILSTAEFDDPTAILTGNWHPDQEAQGVVYSVNPTEVYYQEVEIRLRAALLPHVCTGYEIFFRCLKTDAAYMNIVRWDGPLAKFTYLVSRTGAQYGVAHGDVIRATVIGSRISAYVNDRLIESVEDDTYPSGSPGIGFNYGCGETYGDHGFSAFMAREIEG